MQVSHLRISEVLLGMVAQVIYLSFEYGANTDLAFIEVNEKIDAAMNFLRRKLRASSNQSKCHGYSGV